MTSELESKLSELMGHATRYEVMLSHPDGHRYLVCYGPRSRKAVLRAILKPDRLRAIVAIVDDDFSTPIKDGFKIGEWTVKASGRTQRQAYIEGELAYVEDVKPSS